MIGFVATKKNANGEKRYAGIIKDNRFKHAERFFWRVNPEDALTFNTKKELNEFMLKLCPDNTWSVAEVYYSETDIPNMHFWGTYPVKAREYPMMKAVEKESKAVTFDIELVNYCKQDVLSTVALYNMMEEYERKNKMKKLPEIKKVIFNDPVTVVLWADGTKTIVRCTDTKPRSKKTAYDPEKGLSMAISKKALGNEGNYYETFKKWLPKEDKK